MTAAKMDGDRLVLTRVNQVPKKGAGKKGMATTTQTITARVSGDDLQLTTATASSSGKRGREESFTGKRTPPLPPAPDLSKVQFGPPIVLFNGKDLTGWKVIATKNPSGWCVENGLLVNHAPQTPGKPHKAYSNLRTEREFEDFNLTLETRVPKDGNSGIYLRGIYEVQVFDSYGKPLDCHNMGAVYSRICPTAAVEKPAGQWQTFDITFVDRHVTVILNGMKIIDNQPLLGCTGGVCGPTSSAPARSTCRAITRASNIGIS